MADGASRDYVPANHLVRVESSREAHPHRSRSRSPPRSQSPRHIRRAAEAQLEARLVVLSANMSFARDPKNKDMKKIFVGNLAPTVNGDFLRMLFTHTLQVAYPQWNKPGFELIHELTHKEGQRYAFIEFRSSDMATAALEVNGVDVQGSPLQVARPTGYIDLAETQREYERVENELAELRAKRHDEPSQRLQGGREVSHAPPLIVPKSCYLVCEGILTPEAMDREELMRELLQDARDKAKEFGTVVHIFMPRQPLGIDATTVFNKSHIGKTFIQYQDVSSAERAQRALHGMAFDGRSVSVRHVDEASFRKALGF